MEWQPISTAPRDGRWIAVAYHSIFNEPCLTIASFVGGEWRPWAMTGGRRVEENRLELWAPLPELPADFIST